MRSLNYLAALVVIFSIGTIANPAWGQDQSQDKDLVPAEIQVEEDIIDLPEESISEETLIQETDNNSPDELTDMEQPVVVEETIDEPAEEATVEESFAEESMAEPVEEPEMVIIPTNTQQPAPASSGAIFADGIIPSLVHDGDIVELLRMLSIACNSNIIPSKSVTGEVRVSLFDVTCKEALDAVLPANGFVYEEKGAFIFVYTEDEFARMQAINRKTETRVFTLNYIPVDAAENIIDPILSKDGILSMSPETESLKEDTGDSWAAHNCIVAIDYPENLDMMQMVLKQIDVRPPQVLIEATILVATVNDTNELGVDFNVLSGVDFVNNNGGFAIPESVSATNGTEISSGTGFNSKLSSGGLTFGVVRNNIGIMVKALESVTDVVTLGNPKVLTLNRQYGRVIVGNKDGYITTEVSQTTATQTVEFLETGTQLRFRPFVMDDGYIRMELMTKDSDGGVESKGNFVLPSEKTAEVVSNVLVKDGNTIVIGGLFRDKTSVTRNQVPLLGDVPGLGVLFRGQSDTIEKEEVIFLITPHIIQEKSSYAMADKVMEDIEMTARGGHERLLITGRTKLADHYYRQARMSVELGDIAQARKQLNRCTEILPLHKDALALQMNISDQEIIESDKNTVRDFIRKTIEQDNLPAAQ